MIRFALVVASVLGFVLTAALGNMMVPLLRELQRAARGTQPDSDAPDSPVPTMGGLCLMVGTLAAVGVGWLAACAAQPSLLGSDRQMTSRLLIALLGSLAFGAVGLADDLARIRGRYPNGLGLGLRRTQRLALECIAAVLVLGLLGWTGIARLVYGNTLSVREKEYVLAARALGGRTGRILRSNVLPNVIAPVWCALPLRAGRAILSESSLSFLGVGIRTPQASWGNLIQYAASLPVLTGRPWVWVPPGLCIILTVLCLQGIGDGLRDALDPRYGGHRGK